MSSGKKAGALNKFNSQVVVVLDPNKKKKPDEELPFTSKAYSSQKNWSMERQQQRSQVSFASLQITRRQKVELNQQKVLQQLEKQMDCETKQQFVDSTFFSRRFGSQTARGPFNPLLRRNVESEATEVEALSKWNKTNPQCTSGSSKRLSVDPDFIQEVKVKANEVLNSQPELLLKSKRVTDSQILRAPSRQLQSIIKQKAQKNQGIYMGLDLDTPSNTTGVEDLLKMKNKSQIKMALQNAQILQQQLKVTAFEQQEDKEGASKIATTARSEVKNRGNSFSNNALNQKKGVSPRDSGNVISSLLRSTTPRNAASQLGHQKTIRYSNRNASSSSLSVGGFQRQETKVSPHFNKRNSIDLQEEYQAITKLTSTQRTTFSNYINGEQMGKMMKQVNDELEKNQADTFMTKPLSKNLHLKLKEVAMNYEISLELKSKEYQQALQQKLNEVEAVRKMKESGNMTIENNRKMIVTTQRELQNFIKSTQTIQISPNTPTKREMTEFENSSEASPEVHKQVQNRKIKDDYEKQIEQYQQHINLVRQQQRQEAINEKQLMNEQLYLEKEISVIQKEQLRHYYQLLQLGLDPRQDGLSWIVKSIWFLGESINISKMPKWLDTGAREFLLDYSRLQLDISNKVSQLKKQLFINKDLRLASHQMQRQTTLRGTFKLENANTLTRRIQAKKNQDQHEKYLERISKKMKHLSNNSKKEAYEQAYFDDKNKFFLSLLNDQFREKQESEDSLMDTINNEAQPPSIEASPPIKQRQELYEQKYRDVLDLEADITYLKQRLKQTRKEELNRILKEFLHRNYEKKRRVPLEVVVSALVGEFKTSQVLAKLKTKTEQMKKVMEASKTFHFTSHKSGLQQLLLLDPSLKIL